MGFSAHAESFLGKRVEGYDPDTGASKPPGSCYYRLGGNFDDGDDSDFAASLDRFLSDPKVHPVVGLVIGAWSYEIQDGSDAILAALAAERERLPDLRGLFFGDILQEECEVSWINHGNASPLLNAFPALEHFRIRGSGGLRFLGLKHRNLRSLIVETGGLSAETIGDIVAADLPSLEHLELWIGTDAYGAPDDFAVLDPLLRGKRFPKLHYLGLRNAQDADALASRIAGAKILDGIRVLDLSLGSLTDDGLDALLARSESLRKLERLDLHHHYLSDAGMERARSLGVPVDLGEQREPERYGDEEYRFNLVSE